MKELCLNFGGPRQYLNKEYDTPEKQSEFARQLYKLIPESETVTYHRSETLPSIFDSERADKPTQVGWDILLNTTPRGFDQRQNQMNSFSFGV